MKKLIIQAFSFFGISGIGWIMDMVVYTILTSISINELISNIISSGIAVTFVYLISTKKLFKNGSEKIDLKKKYILYIIYQITMISFSSCIIFKLANALINTNISLLIKFNSISAKIIVTPFTMVINFIFMKFLIEKVGKNG